MTTRDVIIRARGEDQTGPILEAGRKTGGMLGKIKKAFKDTSVAGSVLQGIGQGIGQALVRLPVAAALKFAGSMREAIAESSRFSLALAEVQTLASSSALDVQRLRIASMQMASEFGSMPEDQAKAFYQGVSAGAQDTASAISLMNEANTLATAGVTDVKTAIDGLTSVANAYGIALTETKEISDTFMLGVRNGKTTVEELAANIGILAPTAKAAGLSIEEMVGAVSAITTGGIKTDRAVISFNQTLLSILKPTKQAKEEAAALGIEFNRAALETKGLSRFMTDIVSNVNLTDESIVRLFGSVRAYRGVLALTNNESEKFNQFMADSVDKTNMSNEAAQTILQTYSKQVDRLDAVSSSWATFVGSAVTESDVVVGSIAAITGAMEDMLRLATGEDVEPTKIAEKLIDPSAFVKGTDEWHAAMNAFRAKEIDEQDEYFRKQNDAWKEFNANMQRPGSELDERGGIAVFQQKHRTFEEAKKRLREAGAKDRKKAEKKALEEQIAGEERALINFVKRRDEEAARLKAGEQNALTARIAAKRQEWDQEKEINEARFQEELKTFDKRKEKTKDAQEDHIRSLGNLAVTVSGATTNILDGMLSKSKDAKRTILNTISAIGRRLAGSAFTFFLKKVLGAATGGAGSSVLSILGFNKGGVVPRRYSGGGHVTGPQKGVDSVPALLTPDERVLTVEQNQAFETLMGALGKASGPGHMPGPSGGGMGMMGAPSTVVLAPRMETFIPFDQAYGERFLQDSLADPARRMKRLGHRMFAGGVG